MLDHSLIIKTVATLIISVFLVYGAVVFHEATIVHRTDKKMFTAIYWHEGNRFSVVVKDGNEMKFTRIPTHNLRPKILIDVSSGELGWYACEWDHSGFNGSSNEKCEIHIESEDSLIAAGWNHGKFGSGMTHRID